MALEMADNFASTHCYFGLSFIVVENSNVTFYDQTMFDIYNVEPVVLSENNPLGRCVTSYTFDQCKAFQYPVIDRSALPYPTLPLRASPRF